MEGLGIYDKRMDSPSVDGINKNLTTRLNNKICEQPEKFNDEFYPCGREAIFYDAKIDTFLCRDHGFISMAAGNNPKLLKDISQSA